MHIDSIRCVVFLTAQEALILHQFDLLSWSVLFSLFILEGVNWHHSFLLQVLDHFVYVFTRTDPLNKLKVYFALLNYAFF